MHPLRVHPLSCDGNIEEEKYVELIVRGEEIKAAGLSNDLVGSFSDLEKFYQKYASGIICSEINDGNITNMKFDNAENAVNFYCLER